MKFVHVFFHEAIQEHLCTSKWRQKFHEITFKFCCSNNFTRYFLFKTYFISVLDSHVILWNSKQISMRFHKEFGTIVQLFEFNPLSKCANKAVYQICLFWNWTEWEQCTNSKSPVEWYAIFYSNTCLTCFFWIEKRDINRNSYRMSIYFLF